MSDDPDKARAFAVLTANLHYRAGHEGAYEVFRQLIEEAIDQPGGGEDLFNTFAALAQLAGTSVMMLAFHAGMEPVEYLQSVVLEMAGDDDPEAPDADRST